jgi:hypothetical protein
LKCTLTSNSTQSMEIGRIKRTRRSKSLRRTTPFLLSVLYLDHTIIRRSLARIQRRELLASTHARGNNESQWMQTFARQLASIVFRKL